jgi:hypothetical protein
MKLAIMQPYFVPYLGYFSLLKHTDQFVLLDTVQYIRHGWIDRNRIIKPGEGWQYIKVPLRKHSRSTTIANVSINNEQDWRARICGQLQHYKKKAPYFKQVRNLVEDLFAEEYDSIVDLDLAALETVCRYLGIDSSIHVFSGMGMAIAPPNAPDEWALNICKAIPGVDEYWNPTGGADLFDVAKYREGSIELRFVDVKLAPYDQKRAAFEEGLSILDVLMFNDPGVVNSMLDDFALLSSRDERMK